MVTILSVLALALNLSRQAQEPFKLGTFEEREIEMRSQEGSITRPTCQELDNIK